MNDKKIKYKLVQTGLIKKLSFFLIVAIVFFSFAMPLSADSADRFIPSEYIDTVAVSAIVVDLNSGKVFWSKNADMLLFPASTTKMLSTITAIENIDDYSKKIKISENAAGKNHSAFRFKKGDEISLLDLIKAALIVSHNNATIALAEYVSKDEKEFLNLMKKKAVEIGAENTFFENTNGLDSDYPNHKTTANDLVKIASYCLKNNLFKELVATKEDKILINGKEVELKNTNKLLEYDYIKGVKTGYTLNAGFCLVTYADKDGFELLSVALKSTPYGKNYDSLRLINWVYDNHQKIKIVDSKKIAAKISAEDGLSEIKINLYPQKDYEYFINIAEDKYLISYEINSDITLPLKKSDPCGKMHVYINGRLKDSINLVTRKDIESSQVTEN